MSVDVQYDNVAILILAGGISKRMGIPKLLLPFDNKNTFIEKIISEYCDSINSKILLVLNEDVWNKNKNFYLQLKEVTIVPNTKPDKERTYSIQLGLEKIKASKVFIQNTDNPFVNQKLLQKLTLSSPENGYVSPRYNGKGGHPILICGSTINKIRNADSSLSLKDILSNESCVEIDVSDDTVLINIDTPEAYKIYFPKNEFQLLKKI